MEFTIYEVKQYIIHSIHIQYLTSPRKFIYCEYPHLCYKLYMKCIHSYKD